MIDQANVTEREEVPSFRRIAVFGGVYNNYLALEVAIEDARNRSVDAVFCLGDLGAFGPHPNRVFPLLIDNSVSVVRGNYDDSIGRALNHCQCGYTDRRDNRFAAISYAYTYANTDSKWRSWLLALPQHRRIMVGGQDVLLCHGSPRQMNEFLWDSGTSTAFLSRLFRDFQTDVVLTTHTGIKWQRRVPGASVDAKAGHGPGGAPDQSAERGLLDAAAPLSNDTTDNLFVNVGVLGRPENDGATNVWYAILEATDGLPRVEFVPVHYDHERLAAEMRDEELPEEFVETILTGWWTTCLEILPVKERRRGRN